MLKTGGQLEKKIVILYREKCRLLIKNRTSHKSDDT